MKKSHARIALAGIGLFSAAAQAGQVKITSFYYTGPQNRAAELCGQVMSDTPKEQHFHIRVLADPGLANPGVYNTIAAEDGKFCVLISTSTGYASANVWGESQAVSATAATAQNR